MKLVWLLSVLGICFSVGVRTVIATSSHNENCKVIRACSPCAAHELGEGIAECITGYYQVISCSPSDKGKRFLRQQVILSEIEDRYTRRESCTLDTTGADSLIRFELVMFMSALYSLHFVFKRKRAAYRRLTDIVNS